MPSHHTEERATEAAAPPSPASFRRPARIDLMAEGTREILVELCRNPGASAADIGESLFLSPGAVRLHLRALLSEGLVEYVTYRGNVGRPRHSYQLTRLGRSLFPSASEQILVAVLDRLRTADEAVYDRVLQEIETAFTAQPFRTTPVEATPIGRRAEQLQRIASEFGHECEARVSGGRPEYRVYNCAIFEVARKNPAICEAERRWLEGFFPEGPLELDTWMVRGDLFCRFLGGRQSQASQSGETATIAAEANDDDLSAASNPS
ncbi:MAG TPA: winged helix-turn-helix transcriptional regulator [Tepidiformaceae bacterium]|nr:winged helix-turn-helix transcriptional regulator [Tepidiformaceae bacterium]HMO95428.1 winged helix-turn-helix transcriptional regulator [Tepidiformaceae bacterium]